MARSQFLAVTAIAVIAATPIAGCAASLPKAELDRCNLGVADGNDAYPSTQGAACGLIARRLEDDQRHREARGYARKACQLQDAVGCTEYLALVRRQSNIAPDELLDARTAGEQACAGMVLGSGGADARPALCAQTAELYLEVEPVSTRDAVRLLEHACKLSDDRSCARARALGGDPDPPRRPAPARAAEPHVPASAAPVVPAPAAGPAPACHEMRSCVTLELVQRNANEVEGTLTNHCDGPVACAVCPSNGEQVDKTRCHDVSLSSGEWRSGREAGLGYVGYAAMAYECMAAGDDRGCLGP